VLIYLGLMASEFYVRLAIAYYSDRRIDLCIVSIFFI